VNNQTFPADCATKAVEPAAASACASVGKFSSLQTSGPAGSSVTFFSANGLMTSACCANTADCAKHTPAINIAATRTRNSFMATSP
jgi:hypothetical protein